MSKKKALVSLLLCGAMIFGALPVSAEGRTPLFYPVFFNHFTAKSIATVLLFGA